MLSDIGEEQRVAPLLSGGFCSQNDFFRWHEARDEEHIDYVMDGLAQRRADSITHGKKFLKIASLFSLGVLGSLAYFQVVSPEMLQRMMFMGVPVGLLLPVSRQVGSFLRAREAAQNDITETKRKTERMRSCICYFDKLHAQGAIAYPEFERYGKRITYSPFGRYEVQPNHEKFAAIPLTRKIEDKFMSPRTLVTLSHEAAEMYKVPEQGNMNFLLRDLADYGYVRIDLAIEKELPSGKSPIRTILETRDSEPELNMRNLLNACVTFRKAVDGQRNLTL